MFSKCVINEVELYYTISKRSYIIHTFPRCKKPKEIQYSTILSNFILITKVESGETLAG